MPVAIPILVLGAALLAGPASASRPYEGGASSADLPSAKPIPARDSNPSYDPYDPRNCNGVDWDDTRVLTVAKVTAKPRVNFIKSPYDDDFKAAGCPAADAACRKSSYLVTGDYVLVGRTRGDFTCVSYQSAFSKRQIFTSGWLPSAALTRIAPLASPQTSDWVGTWQQPHGRIQIKRGGIGGRLRVDGVMVVPTARDFHNGAIDAQVIPRKDSIAFLNDGWLPFETKCEDACRVRMQRIGPWLLVEDNGGCGGAGVSFTGLFRRK